MKETNRFQLFDNVRVLYAILIILCHVALSYSSTVWWFYKADQYADWALSLYQVIAAVVMPGFFFIFGYFFLGGYLKTSPRKFMSKRIKKYLTVVLLGVIFIVIPLSYYYHIMTRNMGNIGFLEYVTQIFIGINGEPLNWYDPYGAPFPDLKFAYFWFLQHVAVYTFLLGTMFLLGRKLAGRISNERIKESFSKLIYSSGFLLFLAILSIGLLYWVRIYFPLDYWTGMFGFIQIEYANGVKYVFAVTAGILFYKSNVLDKINKRLSLSLFLVGCGLFVGALLFRNSIPFAFVSGDASIHTFLWSLYDFVMSASFVIGSIVFFRDYVKTNSSVLKKMSTCIFGVYVMHAPVTVFIQHLMGDMVTSIVLNIIIQTMLAVILSFSIVYFYQVVKKHIIMQLKKERERNAIKYFEKRFET